MIFLPNSNCMTRTVNTPNQLPNASFFPLSYHFHRVCFLPHGIIQITSVSDSDGGYYQCFNNSFGRTFSANLTLVVSNRVANTPLDSPRLILAGPTAQDKALGDSALLECLPSRDNLRVSWTRSGKVHFLSVSLFY